MKTHSQLARDELSEGFGHLRLAAAHAAGGVGATVGPRWDSAKGHMPPRVGTMRRAAANRFDVAVAGLVPLMEAARIGAAEATRDAQKARRRAEKRESRMSRKRVTILVSLLTAGAAVGAAGAIVSSRRNRAKWEEYESQGVNAMRGGTRSVADAARESAKETGNVFAEQAKQTGETVATRADEAAEQGKAKTEQLADKAHAVSKNSRS
jgi:hypothetical protein